MATATFKTKFWDTELGNIQSYENLVKRVKEEQKGTKDHLEFLKSRVLAEESHGKALGRLAKISVAKNELGILHGSWQNSHVLCADFEVLINLSVQKLNAELDHNVELLNRQMEQRRKEDETVKEAHQAVKHALTKLQSKQKLQQIKTKELEKARASAQDLPVGTKEAAKAGNVVTKTHQQWEAACSAVNLAETQLEECRSTWEYKMELALETLQALQEQRLNSLANLQEVLLETFQEQYQTTISALSRWKNYYEDDVTQEVCKFVQRHGNNNERPAVVTQTDFNDGSSDTSDIVLPDCRNAKTSSSNFGATMLDMSSNSLQKLKNMLPTPTTLRKTKAPKALSGTAESNEFMVDNSLYGTLPAQYSTDPFVQDLVDDDSEEPVYAVVQESTKKSKTSKLFNSKSDAKKSEGYSLQDGKSMEDNSDDSEFDDDSNGVAGSYNGGGELMRVLYDYNAKHPTDISLREGSLVRFIGIVSDEWVEVRAPDGKQGYFPRNYVEPADS
ncbi:uncharacterized protein LOC135934511 [Cloeon dipterum]|uniref:uncharacterized protein LOC135934511 n=1 Tax=Cloeon dipterum TaxID=197152 RepID=UPI003220721D